MTLPSWIEVRALVPEAWSETAALVLGEVVSGGAAFGRPSLGSEPAPSGLEYVRLFFQEGQDSLPLRGKIQTCWTRLGELVGPQEWRAASLDYVRLAGEDYANSWRKDFRSFRLGPLLVVAPQWKGRVKPHEVRLELEPGGAFGTGRHATTRGCLSALLACLRPGERVLDAGTGSGILAVAAAMLGARSTLGFDNDPCALPYAEDLALRNGCASACQFLCGGFEVLETQAPGRFDGVLANLYADVLSKHAADLARALAPGGWFVLSGIASGRQPAVLSAARQAGLVVQSEHVRGRWTTLRGRKAFPRARS